MPAYPGAGKEAVKRVTSVLIFHENNKYYLLTFWVIIFTNGQANDDQNSTCRQRWRRQSPEATVEATE